MHISLMASQTYTLSGDFTVATLYDVVHSVCAKHDIGVDCCDCEIQTNVNALCSYRRDISLCMILQRSISLKELEHILNVTKYTF